MLYRLLQAPTFPLLLVYLLARALKDRRYLRGLMQRFGRLPRSYQQTAPGAVWLHAVSVGEVASCVELVRRVRARIPTAPVFVSVTTPAGREVAQQRLGDLVDGIFYAPVDYCFAVRRVLRLLRPRLVAILETEIWPNLWHETRRAGCTLVVLNARISDRAMPRYRRWRRLFAPVLELPDAILAQNPLSRERYLELGAPPHKVQAAGNLKHDFDPDRATISEAVGGFLERCGPAEVWIAASTMPPAVAGDPDEDQAVIAAFRAIAPKHSRLLLVLVPRRPDRFDTAARLLAEAGVPFLRRSALDESRVLPLPGVLLLDTIGELAGLFRIADVVFMGGTLAHRGGHNILEPAAFGRTVIVGPHMENFPTIIEAFRSAGAVVEIRSAEDLGPTVAGLLADPARRRQLGERARRAAAAEQGATGRALEAILTYYAAALPEFQPAWPLRAILWPLSQVWLLGGKAKRRLDAARRQELATPVVSVGSLAMGGAGKTPFTLWLAGELRAAGRQPAILVRGYRRRIRQRSTVLAAGAQAPPALTGDEAQIHLRSGLAPVGVGADRASAGRLIEKHFRPDLFLLDDGFQHVRLARDLDIVLVDALDPFGRPFPLGRFREPPEALARAGLIIIMRAKTCPELSALERAIRRYNPDAPLFRAHVKPMAWVEARTGEQWPADSPPFRRAAAFCGLAQPASFWRTLAGLGCHPTLKRAFPDHHRYCPAELRRLAAEALAHGAEALLTTEKDLMNLSPGWEACVSGLPLYWLRVSLEVEEGSRLLALIQALSRDTGRLTALSGGN